MNFSSFAPSSFFVTLTCNEDRGQERAGGKIYMRIDTNDGAEIQIEACRAMEQIMAEACETRDDDDDAA